MTKAIDKLLKETSRNDASIADLEKRLSEKIKQITKTNDGRVHP